MCGMAIGFLPKPRSSHPSLLRISRSYVYNVPVQVKPQDSQRVMIRVTPRTVDTDSKETQPVAATSYLSGDEPCQPRDGLDALCGERPRPGRHQAVFRFVYHGTNAPGEPVAQERPGLSVTLD